MRAAHPAGQEPGRRWRGAPLADGDVAHRCQQACPTGAIVFGDLKDPDSRVSKLLAGRRAYRVLEELGTRPAVGYLKKVAPQEDT